MNGKKFCLLLVAFVALFLLLGALNTANATNVDFNVTSNVDDNVIDTIQIDDRGSKTVWGIENNAELRARNGGSMANTYIEKEDGRWTYDHLENNGIQLDRNDRVYGKEANTLVAIYTFSPYMFAEINVIDEHGNAGGGSTYPAMKETGDTITHTFKPFTDVDPAYTPLYIQDLETNETYNPGDSFKISYDDVAETGINHMVKNFQYMYEKIPTFNAEITVIDPQGNADRHATFPGMKPGDELTQTFADPVDYDTVHYDFWHIQNVEDGKIFAPGDSYSITYDTCLANNQNISVVFEYKYGHFPDYTVTYISINPNGVFDNVTITVNRENWSVFYTLPEAPEIAGKVLDYIRIVEDDVYNYKPGNTYEAMYDMCLSEGNNLTRTFEYNYKQGAYANVTVNYIFNIDNELNNTIFHSEYYPMLVIGDEAIGGYVDYHPEVAGYDFTYVTFQEIITNGVKGMLPGSNVRDEGGFWVYEVNETGNIDLNFIYNYVPKVDPTPIPPTPVPGNETADNDTNETDPVIPTPTPIVPVDNKVVNNTNSTNTNNVTAKAVSNDSNVVTMLATGKNPWIAIAVLIIFILVFVAGYYADKRDEN